MRFVNEGHLGGYVAADEQYPNGDPMTYTPKVWQYLLDRYDPHFICDIGCGQGHSTKWFHEHTDPTAPRAWVVGVDGCAEAIRTSVVPYDSVTRRHVTLWKHDFSQAGWGPFGKLDRPKKGPGIDLIWSCEFVEHVEGVHVGNVLETFNLADVVAMTHAFPGQPGHHHVNCQPTEYWIDKMAAIGFQLNHIATAESHGVAEPSHWKRSGLIFEKVGYVPKSRPQK